MKIRLGILAGLLGASLLAVQPASADPLAFYFSFSNSTANGCTNCNVTGTVTGEIFGLENNSEGPASEVEVLSYPSGISDLPTAPFTVADYASDLLLPISENDFVVSNGMITYADYQIFGGYFDINVAGQWNTLTGANAEYRVQNLLGLSGITFTPVPEPSSLPMLLMGLGFIGGALSFLRRKKAIPLKQNSHRVALGEVSRRGDGSQPHQLFPL